MYQILIMALRQPFSWTKTSHKTIRFRFVLRPRLPHWTTVQLFTRRFSAMRKFTRRDFRERLPWSRSPHWPLRQRRTHREDRIRDVLFWRKNSSNYSWNVSQPRAREGIDQTPSSWRSSVWCSKYQSLSLRIAKSWRHRITNRMIWISLDQHMRWRFIAWLVF